jgi:hypothetical protein
MLRSAWRAVAGWPPPPKTDWGERSPSARARFPGLKKFGAEGGQDQHPYCRAFGGPHGGAPRKNSPKSTAMRVTVAAATAAAVRKAVGAD